MNAGTNSRMSSVRRSRPICRNSLRATASIFDIDHLEAAEVSEATVLTTEAQRHGGQQRREWFDGSACAAGRMARTDRIVKTSAARRSLALVFSIRSVRARRFATPVEPALF